jgi:hypothetical protein
VGATIDTALRYVNQFGGPDSAGHPVVLSVDVGACLDAAGLDHPGLALRVHPLSNSTFSLPQVSVSAVAEVAKATNV